VKGIIDLVHSLLHAVIDIDQSLHRGLAVDLVPFHLKSGILEITDLGLQQDLAIIQAMTMTSVHIGMATIGLEDDILKSHVIIMCLLQEEIRVGVLVLEKESHTEIVLNHQNIIVIGVLSAAQEHQDIPGEAGVPLEAMMRKGQSTVIAPGLSPWRIGTSPEKEVMREKKTQGIVIEGGLGQHLMRISTVKPRGHCHNVPMKRHRVAEGVRDQDLWMLSIVLS